MSPRISLLSLLTALLLWAGVPARAQTPPPTVHLLLERPEVSNGLNVLFLGDGFDNDHLATYRKAVWALADGLAKHPVYRDYHGRFNFYRIDVLDSSGATASNCPSPFTLASIAQRTLSGAAGPGVRDTAALDLGVTCCWGGAGANILYSDDDKIEEALSLASYAPDIAVVVIVANADLVSGGAQLLVDPAQMTVLVMGVPIASAGRDTWAVSEQAVALFAHELGHALGLLDEYDTSTGLVPPTFPDCRNVWHPANAPTWPSTGPTWPATETQIPWQHVLHKCCTPQSMARCGAHDTNSGCVLDDLTKAQIECSYVPRSAYPAGRCFPTPDCSAQPGAWEGAFYSSLNYYRARETCRMRSTSIDVGFCEACREYLDLYLARFGPSGVSGPWPWSRCEEPYATCPTPPETPGGVHRSDHN